MTDAEYIRERIEIETKHGPLLDGIEPRTDRASEAFASIFDDPDNRVVHLARHVGSHRVSFCGTARSNAFRFTDDIAEVTCMRCRQCC